MLRRAAADPVIAALLAFLVVGLVWHLTGAGGTGPQVIVLWLAQVPLDLLSAALACRVARMPGVVPAARRFWYAMGFTSLMIGFGDTAQAAATLADPHASAVLPTQTQNVFYLLGVLAVTLVGLAYPIGMGKKRERRRFWFDTGTVLIGAGAYEWYFDTGIRSMQGGLHVVEPLVGCGVLLVTAFAVVKLVLSGEGPMGTHAAVASLGAAGVLAATTALTPGLVDSPHLHLLLAVRMLPAILLALAPRLEERHRRRRPPPTPTATRRRAPYSKLPYVAIAATNVLLISVLGEGLSVQSWGVVVGVIAMTSLVVARQLDSLSENARLLDQVQHQATHDPLTGLPNRTLFHQRLRDTLAGSGGALLLIDLDDFKPINDTLGHHVGDAVLVRAAEVLRSCAGPDDTAARLGGDEFAVVLPGADAAVAADLVDRLHRRLADTITIDGHQLAVQASIGTAHAVPGTGPDNLVREADAAMYYVKRARKEPVMASTGPPAEGRSSALAVADPRDRDVPDHEPHRRRRWRDG